MAKINIVVPPLKSNKFTGGVLCILEHAYFLQLKGHTVTIVPTLPSEYPKWFKKNLPLFKSSDQDGSFKLCIKHFFTSLKIIASSRDLKSQEIFAKEIGLSLEYLGFIIHKLIPPSLKIGLRLAYLKHKLPEADITMATSYETVLPTIMLGKGKIFYLAQHYEPYFKNESIDPELTEKQAELSYSLNLHIIANSPWLKTTILDKHKTQHTIAICPNAIDHTVFKKDGGKVTSEKSTSITIISYGGRDAVWKGFKEMAEAVAIARQKLSQITIHWHVYGQAVLPPNNQIASYEALGFLSHEQLAQAYNNSDILLSASWYESFPLFPLEAMACGLAVISTAAGTEEYCIHGQTAEVAPARDSQKLAESIIKLIENPDYRKRIAHNGYIKSQLFTWEHASNRMEQILLVDSK